MRRFARLLRRYGNLYVPGPDVGSNDADMETVAVENGLEGAVSKPFAMGGNRIDELGAAAGGVVIALERLLEILPRLTVLPQFGHLRVPAPGEVTVLIQGFGAVGAHAARELARRLPAARVVGVSDREGALYDPGGLDVEGLFRRWKETGLVTRRVYEECIRTRGASPGPKFSSDPDDLLRESAFAFIPAAPVFQYLGVLPHEAASQRVDRMGEWTLIVEGANTYSPDPNRKAARMRMEQAVFRQKGILIATDYLVNSGGVIFAAQERLIPTPAEIRIPAERLGDREAVRAWLKEHAGEFAQLSEKRLTAGIAFRERVIRRNMTELVDLLAASPDLLPCQAAERISVRRLAARESERTARDILEPIPTVTVHAPLREAASLIVEGRGNIVAVLDADGTVVGVVTTWDIARAVSEGAGGEQGLEAVMTREVIAVPPSARIPEDRARARAKPHLGHAGGRKRPSAGGRKLGSARPALPAPVVARAGGCGRSRDRSPAALVSGHASPRLDPTLPLCLPGETPQAAIPRGAMQPRPPAWLRPGAAGKAVEKYGKIHGGRGACGACGVRHLHRVPEGVDR